MVNLSLFLHMLMYGRKRNPASTHPLCVVPLSPPTSPPSVSLSFWRPTTRQHKHFSRCACVCPSSDTTAVHPTLLLIYAHVCDCVYVCECVSVPWRSAVGVKRSVSAFQYTSDPRDYCILQPRQRMCNSVYVQKSLNLPVKDS